MGLHLEDALAPLRAPLLESKETLKTAAVELSLDPAIRALVVSMADGGWYVLSLHELATLAQALPGSTPLEKALPPERAPVLFPDLPLDAALRHFSRWPILPVSNRAAKGTLEGMVTLEDVLHRYQRG